MTYFVPVLMFTCGALLGYYLGRAHGGRDTMEHLLIRLNELKHFTND
jgi:hypothetical protein